MPRGIPNSRTETMSTDFVTNEMDGAIDFETLRLNGLRAAQHIEPVTEREFKDVEDIAAFMNDPLSIIVHDTNDKNAPPYVEVAVNGEYVCLPRNRPVRNIPRRFVERLARSMSHSIRTSLHPDHNRDDGYQVIRRSAHDYAFSVLEDPSPRGRQWLQRVTRESA